MYSIYSILYNNRSSTISRSNKTIFVKKIQQRFFLSREFHSPTVTTLKQLAYSWKKTIWPKWHRRKRPHVWAKNWKIYKINKKNVTTKHKWRASQHTHTRSKGIDIDIELHTREDDTMSTFLCYIFLMMLKKTDNTQSPPPRSALTIRIHFFH